MTKVMFVQYEANLDTRGMIISNDEASQLARAIATVHGRADGAIIVREVRGQLPRIAGELVEEFAIEDSYETSVGAVRRILGVQIIRSKTGQYLYPVFESRLSGGRWSPARLIRVNGYTVQHHRTMFHFVKNILNGEDFTVMGGEHERELFIRAYCSRRLRVAGADNMQIKRFFEVLSASDFAWLPTESVQDVFDALYAQYMEIVVGEEETEEKVNA